MNWQKTALGDLFSLIRFDSKKTDKTEETVSPFFFAGTWLYHEPNTNREHELKILPNYDVYLDGKLLKTVVEDLDSYRITFIDRFGYHLVVKANEYRPISVYDKANNETYAIVDAEKEPENRPEKEDWFSGSFSFTESCPSSSTSAIPDVHR